ncbi:hypothetical protein IJ596_04535 [bacterium]|nr:hypothetical protein [bacterium]
MEKKISLKQNAFVAFSLFFSQIMIIGGIAMAYISNYIPEILANIIYVCMFAFAIYRGISALKSNDRTLITTIGTLMLKEKTKKQDVLLFKIDDHEVEKVEQIEEDLFAITKKDGNIEVLPLSFSLKATRELDLEVRTLLCKKYGERAEAISNENTEEYTKTNVVPQDIEKATKNLKSTNMAYAVIGIIFSLIPTAIALLSVLQLLLFILGLIIAPLAK